MFIVRIEYGRLKVSIFLCISILFIYLVILCVCVYAPYTYFIYYYWIVNWQMNVLKRHHYLLFLIFSLNLFI